MFTLVLAFSLIAAADPSPDVTEPPPANSFILVPLNIHILSCKDHPDIDCKLTDADIARIVGKINGIWHKAGIHFCFDHALHEEAENLDDFLAKKAHITDPANPPLGIYRLLAPAKSHDLPGLHLYYVHELPPNGVYLGKNICFVKETASLRRVEGGIDEPLPRVSAHELGHGLGLPHRQNRTNLMASGTTGTILNQAEVDKVRDHATKITGALTVEACKKAIQTAQSTGEKDRAQALSNYLKQITP